jgi:hypothetical protein
MPTIDLTPEELALAIRGARSTGYLIRQEAQRHKNTSSYDGQIREAERFEALAQKLERSARS